MHPTLLDLLSAKTAPGEPVHPDDLEAMTAMTDELARLRARRTAHDHKPRLGTQHPHLAVRV
ncbi:MAG: hypothetical protein ACRCYU_06425 [Nocardioides sp.]